MTDETARLVVAVDSTSASKATDVLDSMTASAGNAEAMVEALSKAFGPVAAEIAKLTAAIDRQVSSYASLDSAARELAATSEQAAKAAETQAQATEALGETADQARERIRSMVSASLDQVRADAAAIEATQRRSDASRTVAADLNSEANSVRRAQESIAAFRQRTEEAAQSSRGAAKGVDDQRAALDKLLKQIDPTIAALEKLDQQEAKLKQFKAAGMLGGDDFDRFMTTIQQRRKDVSDVGEAMHGFSLNTAAARREVGTLVSELARGNFGDFQRSLITLAGGTGIFTALLSPAAIGVGVLATAVVGLGVAAVAGAQEQQLFAQAIIGTGNFAGQTTGSLQDMARSLSFVAGTQHATSAALAEIAASGKFTADQLYSVGAAAISMSAVTGQSVGDTVQQFTRLADAPTKAIADLNDQYHFLTISVYDQIKALEQQGRTQDASTLAIRTYSEVAVDRANAVEASLSNLERGWASVKNTALGAWDAMIGGVGRSSSVSSKIQELSEKIVAVQNKEGSIYGSPDLSDASRQHLLGTLRKQLADLTRQEQQELRLAYLEGNKASLPGSVIAFDQEASSYDTTEQKRAREIAAAHNKANDLVAKAFEVGDIALAARIQEIEKKTVAGIEAKYTDKAGKSASKALDTAEASAEASAFKAALAQITTSYANAQKELDAQRKSGAVSEETYYQQSRDLLWRGEAEQVTAIQAEMARLQARKVAGADKVKNDQRVAELSAEAHKIEADAISRDNVLVQEAAAAKEKAARAIQAYVEALGRQEAAARADADLQVQRLSMGDREFANMQRIVAIRRQGADELVRLASQLSNKQIDQSTYDQQAAAQQASTDRLVQIEQDGQQRVAAAREDWVTGSRKAMADLQDQATDAAGAFGSFVSSVNGGLSDFLVNAATKGKASIKGFVSSVLTEVARLEANRAAASLISYGLSFIPGLGGGSVPSTSSSGSFSLSGGTYSGSGSMATTWGGYRAGGGSTSPNSAYRVAEQGPEVYRTPGGQTYLLTGQDGGTVSPMQKGVGGGPAAGGTQVNVTVNVASDGSTSGQVDPKNAGELGRDLGQQMQAVAEQTLARAMMPGGKLWRQQRG